MNLGTGLVEAQEFKSVIAHPHFPVQFSECHDHFVVVAVNSATMMEGHRAGHRKCQVLTNLFHLQYG